jgi:hypothetical protein
LKELYKPLTEKEEKLGVILRAITVVGLTVFWAFVIAYQF